MSKPMLVEKWVYTGADFALSHPISQRLGAIWFVVIWMVLHLALCLVGVAWVFGMSGPLESYLWLRGLLLVLFVLLTLNDALGLLGLVGRHPIARPCVWLSLILGFPLSLPLVVYWADGVRPNLIYAHRFETLVPLDETS